MTLIEYPKDIGGKKFVESELFLFQEQRNLTYEDYKSCKLIKEKEINKFWISEHNMIGNKEIIVTPVLISKLEIPIKGDYILREELNGEYSIELTKKNLSNKDLYIESNRMVFKVVCLSKNMNNEHLNSITKGDWEHGDKFYLECENKVYNKRNNKEIDYIFYDSNNIIFKTKKPFNILKA